MWPRLGSSKLVSQWIAATLAVSIIAALDGGRFYSWFSLVPAKVWHGQLWRLVTWPLVETRPLRLVFACAVIYSFGSQLAIRWGDRRLRRFMLQIVVIAGVATTLVATVAGRSYLRYVGTLAADTSLLIAWARQFPDAPVSYYGLISLRGRELTMFLLGIIALLAIYIGPIAMAPELVACVVAAKYPQSLLRR